MVRMRCFTLACAVAFGISAASAQNNGRADAKVESMTGVVRAVYTSSLTLELGENDIRFEVVSSTMIRSKSANGSPRNDLVYRGPRITKLADYVKAGDRVTIKYRESGDALNIVEILILPK